MAFVHGRKTVLKLDDGSGTLRDITTYVNSSSLQRLLDLLDTTTFGANSKAYITGFADAKISFGGFWDATIDGYLAGAFDALAAGTLSTLSWELYPEGTATGKVKYSGEAVMTSYEATQAAQQATSTTNELQVTGAVTRALVA